MECLVTKLKAVVENDNLPIFFDVNDYINYINATGNADMTDLQKYEFAKFLSLLGAVDGGSIWNKIHVMLVPLVCNDVNYAYVNYKDLSSRITPKNGTILRNHGIVATQALNNEIIVNNSINLDDITMITMVTESLPDGVSKNIDAGAILSTDNTHKYRVTAFCPTNNSTNVQWATLTDSSSYISTQNLSAKQAGHPIGLTKNGSTNYGLILDDVKTNTKDVSLGTLEAYKIRPWSSSQMSTEFASGFFMLADGLTSDEMLTVNEALKRLYAAFVG